MAISEVTKDLRRLLDVQNISWEDHSDSKAERTWIPLDDDSVLCCMYPYYATLDGIGFGGMSDFLSKLEVSIIYSTDDYTFKTPRTPEEILEVLCRREEK